MKMTSPNKLKEDNAMTKKARVTTMMAKIQVIADEYTGYWPLTEKQIYYLLLKEGSPGVNLLDIEDLYSMMKGWYPCGVDPDAFINCVPSLNGSFLPYQSLQDQKTGYRNHMMEHVSAIPDFELWKDQENHVELWVNDPEITDFLRIHMKQEIRVPIHDCSRLLRPGPLTEAKARLDYMRSVEGKSSIVLYLASLDYSGRERLAQLHTLFRGKVDRYERIGINEEHITDLAAKSAAFCDDNELREDRLFQKECGLPECYSLHAIEPSELLHMVGAAVGRYYNMEKYPHERVALWQRAEEKLKQSLGSVLDELLEIPPSEG